MTIERIKGAIAFECDGPGGGIVCHESIETGEREFAAARDAAKAEGWHNVKGEDGEWINLCASCIGPRLKRARQNA